MRIKAKDIAKDLGLSTATVSLAINNRPGVNEDTRRRVLEYLESKTAEDEVSGGNEKIIRMLAFLEDRPYWDSSENTRTYITFEQASRRARECGYKMDLVTVIRGKDDMGSFLEECIRDNVAGVYVNAAYMEEEDYACFRNFKKPFVVCDQDFNDLHTDNIMLNNHQGVFMGLDYLYENGHRDILYFRNTNNFYNMYERREAFNRFMEKKGLQSRRNERIVDIGGGTQEAFEGMQRYIEDKKHIPTAIFSENYEVTIGISKALENNGYKIPEDISIVGFDTIPDTALMDYQPTCICALHDRKAYVSIGRLLERIEGDVDESVKIYVNTELIIGDSVRSI